MSAQRTTETARVVVCPGDMLAKSSGVSGLMVHAMLCDEEAARSDVTSVTQLRIAHMGPPLGNATKTTDAVGQMALTDEQRLRIKKFVARSKSASDLRREEYRKRGQKPDPRELYVILPSAKAPSDDFPYQRFSCVGFVLQAYKECGVRLLGGSMPDRTLEEIKRFYPWFVRDLDDPDKRIAMGIGAGDRWPLELVGYVLHAFNRRDHEIMSTPYSPRDGDEFFPRPRAGLPRES